MLARNATLARGATPDLPTSFKSGSRAGIGHNSLEKKNMYAIAFDLDTATLSETYHNEHWRNAYADIRRVLEPHGFARQQGSVYFGDETVDAVKCVLAVMDVSSQFGWFSPAVRDIRMLRIEENNDLMPAVERGAKK